MSAASAARAVRAPAAPARPLGPPRGRAGRGGAPRSGAVLARSASSGPASRTAPAAAAAAPARRAEVREQAAPRVRLVAPPASSRRRLPFGALCGVVLLLSLLAVLLLNISLSHGAYELHAVQGQQREAGERRQALAEQLEAAQAPAELGRRAQALGMVPAGTAAVVRLPDGEVVGTPSPADEPVPVAGGTGDDAGLAPVGVEDLAADEPAPAVVEAEVAAQETTQETTEETTEGASGEDDETPADEADATAEESAP